MIHLDACADFKEETIMKMTTLCYIEKDGCYLMLHRTKKEKDINKGKWIGVGGHAEYAETPEECLLREVKEENRTYPYFLQISWTYHLYK